MRTVSLVEENMSKKRVVKSEPETVDAYISLYPAQIQGKLEEIRNAIKQVAPDAIETTSYFDMPGYSYKGYDYNGMFVWFGVQNSRVGLYLRPPVIEDHKKELARYETTRAIVKFKADDKIPVPLVKKLVKASLDVMKDRKQTRR